MNSRQRADKTDTQKLDAEQLAHLRIGIPASLQEQKSHQRMEFLELDPQLAQTTLQEQLGLEHYSIMADQEWEDPIPALFEEETEDAAQNA